jgi:hypothetical protein
VFAGVSAARFHRPPSGLELSELAQAHIRSMRMLTDELDVFTCSPHPELIHDDIGWGSEAYCLADPGRAYTVCFPSGGATRLDCSAAGGEVAVRWLDVRASSWAHEDRLPSGRNTWLTAPSGAFWAALVSPA